MFLWFVGTAVVSVWFIFRDDAFDYRPLIAGALLPDAVDVFFGGARVMHTVVASVAVMTVIVLSTSRHKPTRSHLMPLAIGLFMHLVFDAAFAKTKVFWWPFSGLHFGNASLPVADRWLSNIALELIGALLIKWSWDRFGLASDENRKRFVANGWLVDQKRRK